MVTSNASSCIFLAISRCHVGEGIQQGMNGESRLERSVYMFSQVRWKKGASSTWTLEGEGILEYR